MSEHVVKAGLRSRERDQGLASRLAANDILFRVDRESGYADVLLGACLPDFAPADRRLITRLVLGTIAWQARLDFELKHLTRRELISIQPVALEILRMGLYQLRFLDRIPQHAVVDTAVSIAKRSAQARRAAGFVNAVMRRATRETAPMPPRERNEKSYLAVAYSHPRWMVERFVDWFGLESAERLMTANNDAAPNVIRLNLARGSRAELIAKLTADGFEIGADGRAPETIVLKSAGRFESVSYREGLFHAQSEASQMVVRMLAPRARRGGSRLCGGAGWQGDSSCRDGRRARSSDRHRLQFQWTEERARAGATNAASQCRVRLRRSEFIGAACAVERRVRAPRRAMHGARDTPRAS